MTACAACASPGARGSATCKKLHPEVEAATEEGRAGLRRPGRDRRGGRSRLSRPVRDDHDAVGRGLGDDRRRGPGERPRQDGSRLPRDGGPRQDDIRSPTISRPSRRAPTSPTRWCASTRSTTCCSRRRCRSRRSKPAASRRADGSYGDNWINWSPYTYPFNLTQQPAASVPCGFTSDGLPIGLQIVGPARQRSSRAARRPRVRKRASVGQRWTRRDKIDPFQTGIANAVRCARLSPSRRRFVSLTIAQAVTAARW